MTVIVFIDFMVVMVIMVMTMVIVMIVVMVVGVRRDEGNSSDGDVAGDDDLNCNGGDICVGVHAPVGKACVLPNVVPMPSKEEAMPSKFTPVLPNLVFMPFIAAPIMSWKINKLK
jgi:hypothetical protein